MAGYLLGAPLFVPPTSLYAGFVRPRSAEIPYAGYAVDPAGGDLLLRTLYAALAEEWVVNGLTAHYLTIPASRSRVDPWLDLGFARVLELGVVETAAIDADTDDGAVEFRRAGPDDEETVQMLTLELNRSFAAPPAFVPYLPETVAAQRRFATEHLADPACPHWLAIRDGRPVGLQMFVEPTSPLWDVSAMQAPERSVYLYVAITLPEARGSGIGAAFFRRSMAWAREAGYDRCTAHYLTASRAAGFWRGLGFQPVSHWLVRAIDERAVWANGKP